MLIVVHLHYSWALWLIKICSILNFGYFIQLAQKLMDKGVDLEANFDGPMIFSSVFQHLVIKMNNFFSLVGRRYLFILMDFSVQICTLETDQEKSPAFLVKVCWMEIQHKHTNCYITSLKTCFSINLKMKKCINVFSVKDFHQKYPYL